MNDVSTEPAVERTWDKLRRRKVVQWGIVYAAGAWGFLQGLEYVSELSTGQVSCGSSRPSRC